MVVEASVGGKVRRRAQGRVRWTRRDAGDGGDRGDEGGDGWRRRRRGRDDDDEREAGIGGERTRAGV